MANRADYPISASTDMYSSFASSSGLARIGYSNSFSTTCNGAFRFQNIVLSNSQSIVSAALYIKVAFRSGSSSVKAKVWGIDEDDTANFSSDPFGRTKTSANNTHEYTSTDTGWFEIGVTSIVEEIISRGGWSSGNSMGFLVYDNGTDTGADNYVFDNYNGGIGNDSILIIQTSATPDFFPTPGTVSAPSFPSASNYGFKISRDGVDVGTASEEDLLFSTRKKVFKVLNEGTIDVSSGTASYTHNLGYNPVALGFIKGTASGETRMYKLNKINDPYNSPDSGGYIVSGTTTTKIISFGGTTVPYGYLYTFIDPLN